MIFTDYTQGTVIASFFDSAETTDSYIKRGSRFTLWWKPGTAQIRVESPNHQEVSKSPNTYSLNINHEITVQLWDDLVFQVKLVQQTFGEGSFLVEFKLIDPRKVPKALKTAWDRQKANQGLKVSLHDFGTECTIVRNPHAVPNHLAAVSSWCQPALL